MIESKGRRGMLDDMLQRVRQHSNSGTEEAKKAGLEQADAIKRSSQFSPLIASFDKIERTLRKG